MDRSRGINVIYLMGTGRSGTTALASVLGNHAEILTLGEINQFYKEINSSEYTAGSIWTKIKGRHSENDDKKLDEFIYNLERHHNVPKYLLKLWPSSLTKYQELQDKIFHEVNKEANSTYFLDSSKYVARALLLSKNPNIKLKIINLSRDSRGVIWSFKKKVQTTNSPIKTVIYYYSISLLTLLSKWLYFPKQQVLHLKYEDLVNEPDPFFNKLSQFLDLDLGEIKEKVKAQEKFFVPEIIGGNRLKSKNKITISADNEWKNKMGGFFKVVYYLITLPFNLIYRYRP